MQAAAHRGCSFSALDQECVTKLRPDIHVMDFCLLLFVNFYFEMNIDSQECKEMYREGHTPLSETKALA